MTRHRVITTDAEIDAAIVEARAGENNRPRAVKAYYDATLNERTWAQRRCCPKRGQGRGRARQWPHTYAILVHRKRLGYRRVEHFEQAPERLAAA